MRHHPYWRRPLKSESDWEVSKRAREEHQLSQGLQPCRKSFKSIMEPYLGRVQADDAGDRVPPLSCSAVGGVGDDCCHTASTRCSPAAEEGSGGQTVVSGGTAAVVVVRGDTGRHTNFLIRPTITYTWARQNEFYESLEGESTGFELHETVRTEVVQSVSLGHLAMWRYPDPYGNEEEHASLVGGNGVNSGVAEAYCAPAAAQGQRHTRPHSTDGMNEDSAANDRSRSGGCYFYESSVVCRTPQPPRSDKMEDPAGWLQSTTCTLLVDCVLKCAIDELLLEASQPWVFLYRGRPIVSEAGRTSLAVDLMRQALGVGSRPVVPLTICLLKKF